VTDAEHVERIARIRAERAVAGRPPYIESPAVYALLSAVIDASNQQSPAQH
jgi:hypothetical protein